MSETPSPSPKTLNASLARAAGFPEQGLRFLDRKEKADFHPWKEIEKRARRVAVGLVAKGFAPGQRAALVYPTGPEFFDAFFGVLLAGGVPVPLYPPVRLGRLTEYHQRTARMLQLSSARIVLASGQVRRLLGETILLARPPLGCCRLEDLPAGDRGVDLEEYAPGEESLGLVQFSSGTTVEPKPVALSHRALLAQTRALNAFWPDSDEVSHSGVSWLPLYHDMGLIGCVFPALERPAVLTLIGPEVFVTRPAIWLRALSRFGATVSPAPNFAYSLCVQKVRDEEMEGVDLSCWRVALNGAEPVAPQALRRFQERFSQWGLRPTALTPVYGLSEAALAVTFSRLDRPFETRTFDRWALATEGRAQPPSPAAATAAHELTSVGHPLSGFAVEIRGEDGVVQPAGQVGRVWVQGPSLMEGYLDQPEATAQALQEGWLDTGDLGFLQDGELYLTGRAKDLLIIRGRNIAPQLAEQAVDRLPGVRTGCSVAVSHLPADGEEEELLFFVESDRGARQEELAELPDRCRKALLAAIGVTPKAVWVLEPGTLPRTSSGKLRRQETLRQHLAGELTAPDPVTPLRMAAALGRSGLAFLRARDREEAQDG